MDKCPRCVKPKVGLKLGTHVFYECGSYEDESGFTQSIACKVNEANQTFRRQLAIAQEYHDALEVYNSDTEGCRAEGPTERVRAAEKAFKEAFGKRAEGE